MIKQIGLLGLCLCVGLTSCAKSEPNYQNFQSYHTGSKANASNNQSANQQVKPSRYMRATTY